jgi:hypothetical protein
MFLEEIYEDLMDTLWEDSPPYNTVKKWAAQFKRDRESTGDDERPWRPK